MSNKHIHISGGLSLSNGKYTCEHGDHFWSAKAKPVIVTNALRRSAVIFTDKLVDNPQEPEQVLNVVDRIHAIVGNYGGDDLTVELKVRLQNKIKELEKVKAYKAKVAEVGAMYPQVSVELKTKVKNFDRYYHYSDDNRVYNAGLKAEEALNKELALINGAAEYAKAYFAIV